jgi:hypothetical protein
VDWSLNGASEGEVYFTERVSHKQTGLGFELAYCGTENRPFYTGRQSLHRATEASDDSAWRNRAVSRSPFVLCCGLFTLTNRISVKDEIKSRLKTGDACYHSVLNVCLPVCYPKILKIKIYRFIILPFVLYGCETWSLTLSEERRLRVFEYRVLRICGPRRDEVTGEWRKLQNEELNDLDCSPHFVRVIKSR